MSEDKNLKYKEEKLRTFISSGLNILKNVKYKVLFWILLKEAEKILKLLL